MEKNRQPLPEELLSAGFVLSKGLLLRAEKGPDPEEVLLSAGVTGISNGCFAGCEKLRRAVLPDSLREIGVGAFMGCVSLRELRLPAGLIRIRKETFSHCSALEEISVPMGVESIGEWAFRSCTSLHTVILPDSLREICAEVFLDCPKLTIRAKENSAGSAHARLFGIPLEIME